VDARAKMKVMGLQGPSRSSFPDDTFLMLGSTQRWRVGCVHWRSSRSIGLVAARPARARVNRRRFILSFGSCLGRVVNQDPSFDRRLYIYAPWLDRDPSSAFGQNPNRTAVQAEWFGGLYFLRRFKMSRMVRPGFDKQ
jgi:hypothetical protein